MRIVVLDTYYPDAIKAMPIGKDTYQEELEKVLAYQFGTADYYSKNLRALGHDVIDIIGNHTQLQDRWLSEKGLGIYSGVINVASRQLSVFKPDVVFAQDLTYCKGLVKEFREFPGPALFAAQCSCPWPGDDIIKLYDIIFTSFPHYVERIQKLGVQAVYVPLAFESSVMSNLAQYQMSGCWLNISWPERIHDCVFIGGVGNPSHWKRGMETLELVAREIPTFKWWGYGVETLPANSILKQKYQGQAFGRDMYEILLRSKIVLNRHGEVSEGYTNNMRTYEATGCGSLLLTEESKNIWDLFSAKEVATYLTPQHAVDKIRYYLEHEEERATIAANGQRRTLKDHTYAKRMKQVSDVLIGALQAA